MSKSGHRAPNPPPPCHSTLYARSHTYLLMPRSFHLSARSDEGLAGDAATVMGVKKRDRHLVAMATAPGDYVHFKSVVPLRHISIGAKQWRYFDFGPKTVPPLVCLCGTAGTADVFYKQILSLSQRGYRLIAADAPAVWSHQEWVTSFEKFLDMLGVHHVHLYGTSLGGLLAQLFAQYRPRRVKSLLLSNTFLDTQSFHDAMTWHSLINWTPEFLLKRYILSGIQDGVHDLLVADSIDFVVSQLEKLSREDLASRLTLNSQLISVGQLALPDSAITIMDTNDYCSVPQLLKDQVYARYPGARRAHLKSGGDFPFLSRPDEVNLHVKLHLKRVGVEGIELSEALELASKDDSDGDAGGGEDSHMGQQEDRSLSGNGGGSMSGLDDPFGSGGSALFRDVPSGSDAYHGSQQAAAPLLLVADDPRKRLQWGPIWKSFGWLLLPVRSSPKRWLRLDLSTVQQLHRLSGSVVALAAVATISLVYPSCHYCKHWCSVGS